MSSNGSSHCPGGIKTSSKKTETISRGQKQWYSIRLLLLFVSGCQGQAKAVSSVDVEVDVLPTVFASLSLKSSEFRHQWHPQSICNRPTNFLIYLKEISGLEWLRNLELEEQAIEPPIDIATLPVRVNVLEKRPQQPAANGPTSKVFRLNICICCPMASFPVLLAHPTCIAALLAR